MGLTCPFCLANDYDITHDGSFCGVKESAAAQSLCSLHVHVRDAHSLWRACDSDIGLNCICGYTLPRGQDKYYALARLVTDHLSKLTPEQIREHHVLWQLGARLERVE